MLSTGTFSGRPMTRPMPSTMGTGLPIPFTRTPQEQAIENYQRKKELEDRKNLLDTEIFQRKL